MRRENGCGGGDENSKWICKFPLLITSKLYCLTMTEPEIATKFKNISRTDHPFSFHSYFCCDNPSGSNTSTSIIIIDSSNWAVKPHVIDMWCTKIYIH